LLMRHRLASPLSGLQGRVTLFVMTISYWFGWVSLLNMHVLLNLQTWWLMMAAVLLTAAVAVIVWLDGGVPAPTVRRRLWLPLWLSAELWVAVWALPTSALVGSTIAVTVMMLWLQFCRHLWRNTWRPDRSQRYVLVGATAIILALLTARWI